MATKAENLSFVLKKPHDVGFEDRPIPELRSERDVLVRVKVTGICGSDVHYWQHGRIGSFVLTSPMVLGHESSGVIVRTGRDVRTLTAGDRVALEPGIPCRHCHHCKSGKYNLCPYIRFAATPPYDGTLAKYYVLPEDFCVRLPPNVSLDEGALIEPLAVAVHVVRRQANLQIGENVVVFGAGPVGLLCCAVARALHAEKVVAVDINQERLTFARSYAATETFNPLMDFDPEDRTPAGNARRIRALLRGGRGKVQGEGEGDEQDHEVAADVAIDASGAQPSIATAIHVLKTGGTFVQVGTGKPDVEFPVVEMCVKELNVKGSFRYGHGDYRLAVSLVASGKVSVKELVTGRVPFESAEKAFGMVRDGKGIKWLIDGPQDAQD